MVLVLTALPVMMRRREVPRTRLVEAMREVAGVAGVAQERIAAAPHWQRLLDRLASAPDGSQQAALESALEMLRKEDGEAVLSYGAWHGDWSPWNMASTRGTLLVWDWERFTVGVPLGFDALHNWLRTEVWRKDRNPASAARYLITHASTLLSPFGVGAGEARLTALLYLAELAIRDLADRIGEESPRHRVVEFRVPALTPGRLWMVGEGHDTGPGQQVHHPVHRRRLDLAAAFVVTAL